MQDRKFKTQNSKLKTQKGFTLIEVVMVIVILSVVSAVGLHFLASSARVYALSVNQKNLFDEGKLTLERMCRDIRDARSLTSPIAGGSGSLISFTRTNATVQDSANENIIFRQTGNVLEKVKTFPAVVSPIAGNVSAFTVTRGALEDEIKLVLTLSLGTGENVTLQTNVYPKNLSDSVNYKNYFQNWREEISP
jgi:prepilin-type N-terminal cleavage/methylation domain-containing protein